MSRILTLALFLLRSLFRSLAGLAPVAAGASFYGLAFEYGMDQAQFITVTGVATGVICLLTVLLLAGRADRGSFYPLLARLHSRSELLAAAVLAGLMVTATLAGLMTGAALVQDKLTLDPRAALWIVPTWLAFWLLAATLALPLSSLTSRGGSHLAGYAILTTLLVLNDRGPLLERFRLPWLTRMAHSILWPTTTLLARASAGRHDRFYWLALVLSLLYAILLFSMAAWLLDRKDLLWPE